MGIKLRATALEKKVNVHRKGNSGIIRMALIEARQSDFMDRVQWQKTKSTLRSSNRNVLI